MAKQIAKKQSAVKRMFNWFRRHKIIGVFSSFVIVMALYLFSSWFVLQVQIHFERERFYGVQTNLARVNTLINNNSGLHFVAYCYYESSTNEFIKGSRYCVVRLSISKTSLSRGGAESISVEFKDNLRKYFTLNRSNGSNTPYTLYSYSFENNKTSCNVDVEYYDQTVPASFRAQRSPKINSALLIDTICSGPAKAEYFPVTQD